MTTATTDQTKTAGQDDGPMLMVVTLKSGVQIRMDVSEYTVQLNGLNAIAGLKWAGTDSSDTSLRYVDLDEIAAIHTEWPKATGGAADAG